MPEAIGFIGLGDLGHPIAANLIEAGYQLCVYNRTQSKADALVALGAKRAERPADTVNPGGIVVSLLWDDASVESIVASEDFLARLGPGGVHVSMTTISPAGSRRLAALHAPHGSVLVEAPIFGRPEAAAARKLWVAYAGPREAKERVRSLLDAMGAQGVFDFGEEAGAATTVKLIGNLLIISARASMSEGLALAEKSGLDLRAVSDMLTSALFPVPTYQGAGQAIAAGSWTIGRGAIPTKDLGLFNEAAEAVAASSQIANLLLALQNDTR